MYRLGLDRASGPSLKLPEPRFDPGRVSGPAPGGPPLAPLAPGVAGECASVAVPTAIVRAHVQPRGTSSRDPLGIVGPRLLPEKLGAGNPLELPGGAGQVAPPAAQPAARTLGSGVAEPQLDESRESAFAVTHGQQAGRDAYRCPPAGAGLGCLGHHDRGLRRPDLPLQVGLWHWLGCEWAKAQQHDQYGLYQLHRLAPGAPRQASANIRMETSRHAIRTSMVDDLESRWSRWESNPSPRRIDSTFIHERGRSWGSRRPSATGG